MIEQSETAGKNVYCVAHMLALLDVSQVLADGARDTSIKGFFLIIQLSSFLQISNGENNREDFTGERLSKNQQIGANKDTEVSVVLFSVVFVF